MNPPFCLQANADEHPAQLFRQAVGSLISTPGLIATGGLEVKQKGTPAMTVLIKGGTPAEGAAWVLGNVSTAQGYYYCWNSANAERTVETANASNPRVDVVVARVLDEQYEGAENKWELEVLKGTAKAGATLANKEGAPGQAGGPTLAKSALILAYVLVPAKATEILTADIENVATGAGLGTPANAQVYGAKVNRTVGTEYEPSATRPTFVMLEVEAKPEKELVAIVSVGGVHICTLEADLKTSATQNTLAVPLICPAGLKWKVEGALINELFSSYLPL